ATARRQKRQRHSCRRQAGRARQQRRGGEERYHAALRLPCVRGHRERRPLRRPVVAATQSFGKYTLLANIAQGGMAEVLLAKMHGAAGFEKLVVIKRLLDKLATQKQYVEMFLDEAKIAARLSHSNIVQVLELGEVAGQYFIAMEFLAGLNVSTLAKKAQARLKGMPQDLAAQVVAQACAGLHYAHERRLPDGRPLGI